MLVIIVVWVLMLWNLMSNRYVDLVPEVSYGNPILCSVLWQSLLQANRNGTANHLSDEFLFLVTWEQCKYCRHDCNLFDLLDKVIGKVLHVESHTDWSNVMSNMHGMIPVFQYSFQNLLRLYNRIQIDILSRVSAHIAYEKLLSKCKLNADGFLCIKLHSEF